jgi:hypothetical protein
MALSATMGWVLRTSVICDPLAGPEARRCDVSSSCPRGLILAASSSARGAKCT